MSDAVNHPKHYGGEDNPHEVIKVLEAWLTPEEFAGFCKGNVHKYLARAGKKGDPSSDVAKAAWYSKRLEDYLRRTGQQAGLKAGARSHE